MSDVREVAEAHSEPDPFDEIDRDFFEPEPLHVLVAERIARNEPRSEIARALGLTVDEVAELVGVAIAERRREYGGPTDQLFALNVALDSITGELYSRERDMSSAIVGSLRLQLDSMRLRADLLRLQLEGVR